jgi:hypothetical protein
MEKARWNSTRNDFFRVLNHYPVSSTNLYLFPSSYSTPLPPPFKLENDDKYEDFYVLLVILWNNINFMSFVRSLARTYRKQFSLFDTTVRYNDICW